MIFKTMGFTVSIALFIAIVAVFVGALYTIKVYRLNRKNNNRMNNLKNK